MNSSFDSSRFTASQGLIFAVLAYGSWGLFPLYWKLFGEASLLEIVCHRMIWSLVFLAILVVVGKRIPEVRRVLGQGRYLAALLLTSSLLTANWGIFIYGVVSEQVVEASLGYFINPLGSILLARLFLHEHLSRRQIAAVFLAACGVVLYGWGLGHIPWVAIGLAVTFGLYGLIRKIVSVSPLVGLLVETSLMTPMALALVGYLAFEGRNSFGQTPALTALYLGAGLITTIPLIWFHQATKLLPLSLMGILQYLAPTIQLLLGVVVFHEDFSSREGGAFVLIWVAIALYLSALRRGKISSPPIPNPD